MRLSFSFLCLWVAAAGLVHVDAILPPAHKSLPNLDRRTPELEAALARQAGAAQALARLRIEVPAGQVEFHPILGSPKFIGSPGGFLTPPITGAKRDVAKGAQAVTEVEVSKLVGGFIDAHRGLFGHGADVLADAVVRRDFVTADTGLRTLVWGQQVGQIEVFDAVLIAHLTRNGELVNLASQFVPAPDDAAKTDVAPFAGEAPGEPRLPPATAVALAARDLGVELATEALEARTEPDGPDRRQRWVGGALKGEARIRLVWLPVTRERLRLAWEVELAARGRPELYRMLIDAQDGGVWVRRCLTHAISDATYRVFTADSPSPFSPGHEAPGTNQPPTVQRELITLPALSVEASPAGWIHDEDNETRGNNVDAHTDHDDDDQPELPRPAGQPFRVFDFPLNLAQAPTNHSAASVVQLFYWCNWMHDRLYELGFTEAAGNFQVDNFGRGGQAGDPVLADAQDGGGFNNANFTTPADGNPGRIQMYLWDGPKPARDGDLDAEVILHEYAHGLSNRRVGGGVGLSALQSLGLGEGWSDFYALALLSESSDDPEANFAPAAYLAYLLFGLQENYYFGIRRYPYSVRMEKNPLTLKDIDPGQASAHPGIPANPVFSSSPADEIHNQGEVWCAALWDLRFQLIRKLGFQDGNLLALQLVTDGLNLSPPDPTFLQARDAILQAEWVRTGGAHREELWTAFARRGLGFGATVPPSNTTSGVEEAFDLPDDLTVQPSAGLVASGELGGPFAPPGTTYTLANVGTNAVMWSAYKNATWYDLSTTTGTLPAGSATVPVAVTINPTATTLPQGIYNDLLTFTNHQTHRTQSRRIRLRVGQPDPFSEQFDQDNDLAGHVHVFTPDSSASRYRVCRETATTFPTDPAEGTVLALEDDGFEEVTLTDGKQVVLYGQSYGRVFVSANGFITFLAGTGEFAETLAGHFATPRVSALFDDLNPEEGGTVSWRQLDDRLAVTWQDIPQFRASDRNNFQVELFFDGRIRLTHLDLGARDGLVGLSRGDGIADGFMESDFASYGPCVEPLTLVLPSSTTEGAGLTQGEVALAETRATNVLVTLTSSDPDEIAVPGSVLIYAGNTRETLALSVGDDHRLDGSRLVRITARAEGFGTRTASVSVHDNERAFLDLTLPARATEGDGLLPNAGRVHVDPVPDTDVAVSLVSADPAELVLPSVVIVPARSTGVNFDVTIGDDDWIDGSRPISAQASVQNWGTANAVMPVDDNESLNLAVVLPARVSEGNPVLRGAGSVRLSGRMPTNLVVRLATSDITELRVGQTTVSAGTTSAAFDLTVMDDPEVDGVQDVVVTAAADGFNPGTATLRVYDNESPPAPSNPTPADLATNVPPFTDLAWSPGEGDIMVNGRFETGDLTGWRLESTEDGGFVINDGTFDPPGSEGPLPPFAGRFSALSQQTGSGRRALVQPVTLPPGATTAVLSWAHRVRNQASRFLDPDQEYRVEVRGPGATTLEVLFSTQPGDPLLQDWTEHSADLSRYIGQTVEIVFVENDLPGFLNVHLDNVSLTLGSASAPTAFEVYLGPTPELGETHRLGETSSPAWDLPRLDLDQTYFWQVVARRGAAQTPGPVWQFRVPGVGPVDHFAWSPIPSPQVAGRPFPATLTALDVFENEVASFEGTASLSARTVLPEVTVGTGTNRWNFPLGAFNQDSRLQLILRTNEIGAERRITALTLEVETAPPGTLHRFTVRMKHTLLDGYGQSPVWESTGWTTVLQRELTVEKPGLLALPLTTPFEFNGTNHLMIDLSFNNSAYSADGLCLAWSASERRSIGFRSDSTQGDPLQWSGISPQPQPSHWVPNLKITSEADVAVDPAVTSAFNHGTWQGLLAVNTLGPNLRLRAQDSRGRFAWSQPFAVSLENDASVTLRAGPEPVLAGDPLTYTLTAINVGPAPADGIVLTNTLPDGVTFVSANSSTGNVRRDEGTVVAEIGQLAGGASATVTIVVTPFTPGILTNRVRLARLGTDPDLANNQAEVVTHVITPLLSVGDATVSEGASGTVNAIFPVSLSFAATRPVSVRYATSEGTASAGTDFTATDGTLVFAPGNTHAVVTVPVHGDLLNEPNETFVVRLTEPVHAALAVAEGRGTIVDDDPAPCFEVADVVAIEPMTGTATALAAVALSQPSGRTVQVNYRTANGPATAGSDYEQTSGTLEFPPGVTRRDIPVVIHSDAISEGDEGFQILLSAPVHATVCDAQGTVTIRDRETVEPGRLHHFTWAPLPGTLGANVLFPVTVTARDALEAVVLGFNGRVNLAARSEAPDVIIGSGEAIWNFPFASAFHDARLQCLYLAAEIGPARPLTALALKVASPPGQALGQWTIRLKHTSLSRYADPSWESNDWQIVFQRTEAITGTGWVTFQFGTPFPYNGVDNLLVDFSFNNSSSSADGLCTFSTVEAPRALFYRTDSGFGDPLGWSGPGSPTPSVAAQVPNLRLSSRSPVALSLDTSPSFLNGIWSGELAVREPSAQVVLRADDGAGHLGLTPPLQVILTNDISLTVVPSALASVVGSELTYAIIVTNTEAAAATDVVVRDVIPAGLTFLTIQAPNAITNFAEGVVSARFARLEAAASVALNITFRLESVGPVTNQVTVTRAEPDGYGDNNSVRTVTQVTAPPLLSIEDVFTAEGDAGSPTVAFHLALSTVSPLASWVEFATFDDGARAGSDYTATNGVLIIPPGATSALLVVPILPDARYETNESFLLRLSQPTNLTLVRTEARAVLVNDDPPPNLRATDFVQREGNTGLAEALFRVTLEPAVDVPVAVRYATANGTAKVNTDYLASTGLLAFDPGVTTQFVSVTIKGDVAIEPDETLHLDLSAPTNAVLATARGTLTLLNDDGLPGELHHFEWAPIASAQVVGQPFAVEITARDGTGAIAPAFQGSAPLAARAEEPEVTLGDGASSWNLPFDCDFHDGRVQVIYPAAELGPARRLTGLALDVTQLPGQVLRRFNIRLRATALTEYPSSGASWEDEWTTVYTRDQQIASTGWTEFTFDQTFDHDGVSNLMIDFSFNNDAATSSGQVRATTTTSLRSIYQRSDSLLGNPLSWSGPTTPVPVTASQVPNVRLFSRALIALAPAEAGPFVEGRWNGTVTLLDPGTPIQITATDGDGHEGASSLLTAILVNDLAVAVTRSPDPILPHQALVYSITITNTGPLEATGVVLTNLLPAHAALLSVHTTQGTTDTSAAPFVTGALGSIAAGATATVTITVAAESPGWLTNLVQVTRQETDAYLANNSATTVTRITPPPLLAIADTQVAEGTGGTTRMSFDLNLSFSVPVPVTVRYRTVSGSATAGSDFGPVENARTFEPGITHQTVDVTIVADNANEVPETFSLELFDPTVAQLGDASAVGLILDDDPLPALAVADVRVVEGDTGTALALLEVTLSPPSGQLVTVAFATASDSAFEATDYIATSGFISFPPGQVTQFIAVPILGDVSVEPDEHFSLDLTNPVNATLARSRAATVIVNDDGLPGQVNHFAWSPLPSGLYAGVPWFVTLEARDFFGARVTNFTGTTRLSAPLAGGDLVIGSGTASWDYPLNTIWEDTRVQSIYLANELEGPRRITALAIYVTVPPGQALEDWTVRLKHTNRASYGNAPSWEASGWTVCYRASPTILQTGWHTFAFTTPFDYDGTNHLMADFSYNNSSFTTSGQVRFSTTSTRRSIFSSTDSWEGDPVNWDGPNNPQPNYANRIVNIRLTSSRTLPLTPALTGPFVEGAWVGALTLGQPGTNLVLHADDGAGHVSPSPPFTVALFLDTDEDGLPSDWELAYRLDPDNASDAASDLDGDGHSNLDEFRAGTDPTSVASALRILGVSVEDEQAVIHFPTEMARGYRVERKEIALDSAWVDLTGLLAGDGGVKEVRDAVPADARSRFYRIRLLP